MKKNIVLIGMASAGKSTVSEALAECTGRECIDMDARLVESFGMSIREYFTHHSEKEFRDAETALCQSLRNEQNKIISCGGGVILREENMTALKENGLIVWITRDPSQLHGSGDRPLMSSDEKVRAVYKERLPLYQKYSDITVENEGTPQAAAGKILKIMEERNI